MADFPIWGIAALAAIVAMAAIVALLRIGGFQISAPRLAGLAVACALLVGLGWLVFEQMDAQHRAEQRRAVEARLLALDMQTVAPGSHLACLDTAGGALVDEACEKSLFAAPERVAAALNYVGAQLDVLRRIAALPAREAAVHERRRLRIVRSVEADRFGLVAQVLAVREGCQPASCPAFVLVKRDRIVANMNVRAYDARVERFASSWDGKGGDDAGGPELAARAPQAPSHTPVNIDFPTADSIPAVSIMSNEPGRPGQNGVGAEPQTPQPSPAQSSPAPRAQTPPAPPRRPAQKAAAPRPAPASPQPAAGAGDPFPLPVGSAQAPGAQD